MDNVINLCTYNVNGLSAYEKRKQIFHYLHIKKYKIVMLKETHSSRSMEKRWATEFGYKMYFSHGETNA